MYLQYLSAIIRQLYSSLSKIKMKGEYVITDWNLTIRRVDQNVRCSKAENTRSAADWIRSGEDRIA